MTGITFKKNQNYLNDPCKNQTFGSNKIILTTRLMELYDKIQETVQFLKEKTGFDPEIGIILGTGLSGLADQIDAIKEIAFTETYLIFLRVPQSHAGKLVFDIYTEERWWPRWQVSLVRGLQYGGLDIPGKGVLKQGIQRLMISTVAGGVNEDYQAGDLVFIEDHINLHPGQSIERKKR
ncbi:MAG: hypothetical protein R2784_14430 [Saprospiraceae bacterium]